MRYIKNVATLELNAGKCAGCGMCVEVCPHGVFALENRKAGIINKNACMECGACARNCPASALYVRPGVGCAYAIVLGKIRGTEPTCGCSEQAGACCG